MRGDIDAQIAACNTGAMRFSELFDRWDSKIIYAAMTDLMDYAERRMRAEISQFPDGKYPFEDIIEDDLRRRIAPPQQDNEQSPEDVIDSLRRRHEERLAALQSMPPGDDYDVEGMIEEERNRFLAEVDEAFSGR